MARKKRIKQQPQRQNNALSNRSCSGGRPLDYFQQFVDYPIEQGRDIDQMYRYPKAVFSTFYKLGKSNGVGKAVINLPVNKTWQSYPEIQDVTEYDDTGKPVTIVKSAFIKAWEKLINDRELQLWERIKGLDRKQRFGMYAGAFIVARRQRFGAFCKREPLDNAKGGAASQDRAILRGAANPYRVRPRPNIG